MIQCCVWKRTEAVLDNITVYYVLLTCYFRMIIYMLSVLNTTYYSGVHDMRLRDGWLVFPTVKPDLRDCSPDTVCVI